MNNLRDLRQKFKTSHAQEVKQVFRLRPYPESRRPFALYVIISRIKSKST
jgi:hypothetical protein